MTQSSFIDDGVRTFEADEAISSQYLLVKLSGDNKISVAGVGDAPIGVARNVAADGDQLGVYLLNKQGSIKMKASGAISQNAAVYAGASGKITATVTGRKLGVALDAATADGDLIEVLLQPGSDFENGLPGAFALESDFFHYTTTEDFTSILTDSGTAAVGDAAGGVVVITASDGSVADNDEAYVKSTAEVFLFANNKPLSFEARVKWTEANTDDANVIVGLMSAAAANALQDDGAGPAASYSGAVFYKVDGSNDWAAECSIAGTQTAITLSGATDGGAGNYQRLAIDFIPTSSTVATVIFSIDGVAVGSTAAFTYTSATEMNTIVGIKNGSANNEALSVDYIRCSQVR